MQYKTYLPSKELKHIVKRYVEITSFRDEGKLLFVPNGRNFIVFNRGVSGHSSLHNGEKIFVPDSPSISSKVLKAKTLILDIKSLDDAEFPILLVELQPIGYYKIFQSDASPLATHYQKIEEKLLEKYFSKLYTHKKIGEEIAYVEKSILAIDLFHRNKRECIEDVLHKIKEFKYEMPIEELAREFGCSRRSLERKFKQFIGMSPKNYMQTAKFYQSLISYIRDGKSFKEMEFLYTDSSHFNVVSKRLTGKTPSQLYKAIKEKKEIRLYGIDD